ncbi:argininosuccinate lyase [Candidatus Daviesbacteria bacterium RIFCSPHIGHO2_02_FULL_39_12]|uniref:Argininosuccinate lyase n=2 Tax=Candidatus Daviesiibacteriota TaxID=1752718 RepID=A0A1F5JCN6_9BACT|nr:MAG: argininosuccinate lyase [Candidatus Daviesbacteria bacterium RIFCSPHIGHO2_02_FULL_39_12]OGE72876.1 MAG: argininosuccinate lyase [Candidatus Daviesbacteria bacterium RIFCSPLOWO2_02_FULL_38_15]
MNKPKLETSTFIVSEQQITLDMEMVPFDLWGTKVHVLMLLKNKIIDPTAAEKCLKALSEIEEEFSRGKFTIDPEKGAQLTLEAKILEKAGDLAYSVHTGRSRNDQIMVTELLYLREQMLLISQEMISLLKSLLELTNKYQQTIMPGYTHMQPGKITTVGQWALSYLNTFLRTSETVKYYLNIYDMNPLGACESYGTSWSLDREFTTEYLGFTKVWELPQDVIGSRGFAQLGYLSALSEMCLVTSKIGEDLILFNTFEYGIVELGDEVSQRMHPITGSSVMAQKKNPDVLEIIRSTAPQVTGYWSIVANILSSLPMGYNRDARESKEYIHLGLIKTTAVIKTLQKIITTLKFDEKRMLELATTNYSLTTDLADYISQKTKIGYRMIYKIIGQIVEDAIENKKPLSQISAKQIAQTAQGFGLDIKLSDKEILEAINPTTAISRRSNTGGSSLATMQKSIERARNEIKNHESWIKSKQEKIYKAYNKTDKLVRKTINSKVS